MRTSLLPAVSRNLRVLLGALLLAPLAVAAAELPAVKVSQQGTRLLVSGEVQVPVTPATAWSVLTDYEGIPQFVPGMKLSRVVQRDGNVRVLQQQGEMQANNMRMLYFGTLRVVEEPPARLSVQFLDGTFRNLQGQWSLSGKRAPVKLGYQLDFDSGTPYPSPMMVVMLQQQVIHWVSSLAAEMERRHETGKKAKDNSKKSAP
jgi:ribosome-associated toxin RatA of RatAB toxin-antitoxin module